MAECVEEENELPQGWEIRFTLQGQLPFGWSKHENEDGDFIYFDVITKKQTYIDPRMILKSKPKVKGKIKVDAHLTAIDFLKDKNLSGKVVIITGANSGIGFETAKAMSLYGAHVIMACRNLPKGNLAANAIRKVRNTLIPTLTVMQVDLASLESIEEFAARFKAMKLPLHILVCNAAILTPSWRTTKNNIELTFGVNHVGHFHLVDQLKDHLIESAPARVVVVSSESHRFPNCDYSGYLDLSKLPMRKCDYWPILAYNQSKLCNILFTMEANRRFGHCGVTFNAVHPGNMIYSSLAKNSWFYSFLYWMCRPFSKSAAQGAANVVYCATSHELDNAGGYYFNNFYAIEPSKEALDPVKAQELWRLTKNLITNREKQSEFEF